MWKIDYLFNFKFQISFLTSVWNEKVPFHTYKKKSFLRNYLDYELLKIIERKYIFIFQLSCVLPHWWWRECRGFNLGGHALCQQVQFGQSCSNIWHQPFRSKWSYKSRPWDGCVQGESWSFWVKDICVCVQNSSSKTQKHFLKNENILIWFHSDVMWFCLDVESQ